MSELQALRKALPINRLSWLLGLVLFTISFHGSYRNNKTSLDLLLNSDTDSEGYYQYLPALVDETIPFTNMGYGFELGDGRKLNLFMIGVAIIQSPFFLLTSLISGSENYFGSDYFLGMALANSIFVGLAFLLLFRVLAERFQRASALITLVLIFGGTNVLYYSFRDPLSAHLYTFFLISLFMFLAHRWKREKPRSPEVFVFLLCVSLISLIRLPLIVLSAIPFTLFASGYKEVQTRLHAVLHHRVAWLIGILVMLAFWFIQCSYWHHVTDHWFINPYGLKGEGFNWTDPHFLDVLFSHQNGLFVYAPILFPPIVFLLIRAIKGIRQMYVPLAAFAFICLLYSFWWCWWLGGAFGHRGFIDIMPLLCIPYCAFIEVIRKQRIVLRGIALTAAILLCAINYQMSLLYWWPWEGNEWTWNALLDKYEAAWYGVWSVIK